MTRSEQTPQGRIDRRGEYLAITGGALSLLGAGVLGVLAIWSDSTAVWAAAFQFFGASGIWLLTLIQLHQKRLLAEEKLEVAELERQRSERLGGAKTIFDEEDLDEMDKLAMGRRLRSIERYLVPTIALLVAAYHLFVGVAMLPWLRQFPFIATAVNQTVFTDSAKALLFFTGAIAFAFFMLSRYALGMSRLPEWSLLRAGGNFSFGSSAVCLATSVSLLFVISDIRSVELWVGRSAGMLLILIGLETIVNFIGDFYRPRKKGEVQQPFYDSRLLGMFSEPAGIVRSVAHAVDYQFGFKVSETWFFRFLERTVVPLILVQVAAIFALTCIVVVPPGHQAIIEHYGLRPEHTAKPGIHFSWPWPIDRATLIPVERIQRMAIGYEVGEEADQEKQSEGPILWTKRHFKKEYQLLVADRAASANVKVPINLLSFNMPVQWRVKQDEKEVIRFYAQAQDAAKVIEDLAYRQLSQFAARTDILDLLGHGGVAAADELQASIQAACDRSGFDGAGLGVQIVHVGLGGMHPPPDEDVAKTYEDVVSAIETKDAKIKEALGDAAKTRMDSAGTEWQALYDAISLEDKAREGGKSDLLQRTAEVERILHEVIGGKARVRTAEAEKNSVARVFAVKSAAELYAMQLEAYNMAPHPYLQRSYLRMMQDGLKNVRKYIILLDDSNSVIYQLDLKPPQAIDIMGAELNALEKKPQ